MTVRKRKQVFEYQGVLLQPDAVPVCSPSEDFHPANFDRTIAARWLILKIILRKHLWHESILLKFWGWTLIGIFRYLLGGLPYQGNAVWGGVCNSDPLYKTICSRPGNIIIIKLSPSMSSSLSPLSSYTLYQWGDRCSAHSGWLGAVQNWGVAANLQIESHDQISCHQRSWPQQICLWPKYTWTKYEVTKHSSCHELTKCLTKIYWTN